VPLTFLVAFATLHALRYWTSGRVVDAGAAGLLTGLATSMKYPGGLAFLALLAAHAMRRPGLPGWRRFLSRDTSVAAALAALGFFLGTPFALLTPVAFVRGVLGRLREIHSPFGNRRTPRASLPPRLLLAGAWVPVYLLALAGLAWALYASPRG
jgi:hypothetical protein